MVEKPLAQELASVERIIEAAAVGRSALMCGFVERFNPIVMAVQRVIEDQPLHFLAIRHSPVVPRIQTSVVHDLLIHDADLAVRFGTSSADSVSSMMWCEDDSGSVELADAVVHFESSMIANLSASRVGQRKTREIRLTTPTVLVELDLLRQDITVYRNVRLEQIVGDTIAYREQTTIDIPFVRHGGEPLALQFAHLMSLVRDQADVGQERDSLLEPHRIVDLVARAGAGAAPSR
jgi:predicted dehydrogenase